MSTSQTTHRTTEQEARLLAEHRHVPTVPIAEDDLAIIVETLEAEVEGIEGALDLTGPDGQLDPVATYTHLSRYLPMLAHARAGRAPVSPFTVEAMARFADSWREVDGSESDPASHRRIVVYERVGADVDAALPGPNEGRRSLEPRMVTVDLDQPSTQAAVIAVTRAVHYAADELTHVGYPWNDFTPGQLETVGAESQRIARLAAFGERLGWDGTRGCAFTGTEGELLDLAVLLRGLADLALTSSREVTEPTATDDRALSSACARASRLLAGQCGPEAATA